MKKLFQLIALSSLLIIAQNVGMEIAPTTGAGNHGNINEKLYSLRSQCIALIINPNEKQTIRSDALSLFQGAMTEEIESDFSAQSLRLSLPFINEDKSVDTAINSISLSPHIYVASRSEAAMPFQNTYDSFKKNQLSYSQLIENFKNLASKTYIYLVDSKEQTRKEGEKIPSKLEYMKDILGCTTLLEQNSNNLLEGEINKELREIEKKLAELASNSMFILDGYNSCIRDARIVIYLTNEELKTVSESLKGAETFQKRSLKEDMKCEFGGSCFGGRQITITLYRLIAELFCKKQFTIKE